MRISRACKTKDRPLHGVVTTRIVGRIVGMILLLPPPPDGNESGGSVNGSRVSSRQEGVGVLYGTALRPWIFARC